MDNAFRSEVPLSSKDSLPSIQEEGVVADRTEVNGRKLVLESQFWSQMLSRDGETQSSTTGKIY